MAPHLGVQSRCLVPFTSFAEPSPKENDKDPDAGRQRNFWFAIDESRPVAFFAGLWTRWRGARTICDGVLDWEVYGFLTTEPNAVVAPIHEKAMLVILTAPEEVDVWLFAEWEEAKVLQHPPADDMLTIVDLPPSQLVSDQS